MSKMRRSVQGSGVKRQDPPVIIQEGLVIVHGIEMSAQRVADLFQSSEWKFAKTMPQHPHCYTLRQTWKDGLLFEAVVAFMRAHSRTEYFYNRPFKMFDLDDHKYWTMGAHLWETILINRARR